MPMSIASGAHTRVFLLSLRSFIQTHSDLLVLYTARSERSRKREGINKESKEKIVRHTTSTVERREETKETERLVGAQRNGKISLRKKKRGKDKKEKRSSVHRLPHHFSRAEHRFFASGFIHKCTRSCNDYLVDRHEEEFARYMMQCIKQARRLMSSSVFP